MLDFIKYSKKNVSEYFHVGDTVEVESKYDDFYGKRGIVKSAGRSSVSVLIDMGTRKTMVSFNNGDLILVK